jgi:predicted RNA methylase
MVRKHYTKTRFAAAIVRFVTTRHRRVLDPCCGSGALLSAASQRWPRADIAGIDTSRVACAKARDIGMAQVETADALCTSWTMANGRPDLILCNPPFAGERHGKIDARLDIRFFRKASRELARRGTLVFVLPYSIAANPSFLSFRADILKQYTLETAIQLPSNAFEATDATAVAVVLRAHRKPMRPRFVELSSSGDVRAEVCVPMGASLRFDPQYYIRRALIRRPHIPTRELGSFLRQLKRGRYLPVAARQKRRSAIPIVGLSYVRGEKSVQYCKTRATSANVCGGELLIARVGRRAGRDIRHVAKSDAPLLANDCVYVATPKDGMTGYLAVALHTNYVQAQLFALRRGISAALISRLELLRVRIPVLTERTMSRLNEIWLDSPLKRARLIRAMNYILAVASTPYGRST